MSPEKIFPKEYVTGGDLASYSQKQWVTKHDDDKIILLLKPNQYMAFLWHLLLNSDDYSLDGVL